MVHPDDRERWRRPRTQNWRTGDPWSTRYRMIRSDGVGDLAPRRRPHARAGLARQPSTFPGILLDVTEDEEAKTRLESSEREQRSRARGRAGDPVVRDDPPETGRALHVHRPAGARHPGYTPEELMVECDALPADGPSRRSGSRPDLLRVAPWRPGSGRRPTASSGATARSAGSIRFGRRSSPPGAVPEVWQGIAVDVTASRAEPETRRRDAGRRSLLGLRPQERPRRRTLA